MNPTGGEVGFTPDGNRAETIERESEEHLAGRLVVRSPPPLQIAEAIEAAAERLSSRPLSPGVKVVQTPDGRHHFAAHHGDDEGWFVALQAALGSRSSSWCESVLEHLRRITSNGSLHFTNRAEMNAGLALLCGIEPENELQSALALQAVALHTVGIRTAERAMRADDPRSAAQLVRLAKASADNARTIQRLQGKAPAQVVNQIIKVEKTQTYVHHHGPTNYGTVESPAPLERPPLPRQDPARDAVPKARSSWASKMFAPWFRPWRGGTER